MYIGGGEKLNINPKGKSNLGGEYYRLMARTMVGIALSLYRSMRGAFRGVYLVVVLCGGTDRARCVRRQHVS